MENRIYIIGDITGEKHIFWGRHLPERERPNWHYYATEDGRILHFRKEHMVFVSEKQKEPADKSDIPTIENIRSAE